MKFRPQIPPMSLCSFVIFKKEIDQGNLFYICKNYKINIHMIEVQKKIPIHTKT